MKVRRSIALAAALAGLAGLVAPWSAGQAAPDTVSKIKGLDGRSYESAPTVVRGLRGELYFGFEFDYACALGGPKTAKAIAQMGKLAAVIEKSGRRVVYTVAPGKVWGRGGHLDPANLPHGACDTVGAAQQDKVLDRRRPDYLPLRPRLRSKRHQMYWKTDPHWTTVGGAAFAKGVAAMLDPAVARAQRYRYSTESRWGNLSEALGDPALETGERAIPANGVRIRTARGAPDWSGYPDVIFDHSWVSTPSRKTIPGRTVLLGDSFMWYALESLRPVFRQGRFLWAIHNDEAEVAKAIARADTVVLEQYAPSGGLIFSRASFRRLVRHELGRHR